MSKNTKPDHVNKDDQKQTINIQQQTKESNTIGTAGFILALIALFVGWFPIIGWLFWLVALILSFVGIFNKPRGLAIAGLLISLIGIIFTIFVFGLAFLGSTLEHSID